MPPKSTFTNMLACIVMVPSAAMTFRHPGVLIDQQQLDYVIAQIQSGGEPFSSFLKKAEQNTWVNKRTNASGPPSDGIIACGFFDNPDYGCSAEASDAESALVQTYLWMTTKNVTWAERAITIMANYSTYLKWYNTSYNGPLEAAWASDKWARAAEILASTGAPWPAAQQDEFKQMLLNVTVPAIINGSCYNGNWELAMIEGLMGISVFTENESLFNKSIDMWNQRLKAYWYYEPEDGPGPAPGPTHCGTGKPDWFNQVVFNASVNGVSQETCRDFGHMSYGLASTFNAAETARAQGVDLYTPNKGRLAAALEFHADLINQAGYTKPMLNITNRLVCNNTVLKISDPATFNVGMTGLSRLGLNPQTDLPNSYQYVSQYLWNAYYNEGCGSFMMCYEALTHGNAAPGAGPLPPLAQDL